MKPGRYRRAAVVAAVLGLLGLVPLSAAAQMESAKVRIDGMT